MGQPAQTSLRGGRGLITESLAWYSAMGVVEDKYGAEHLQALLSFLREENETPRTRAAKPLLQADDFYQNYRKGPFALYTLSQYIGRDRVNGALRQLLAHHRPGTRPFATSLDLYRELQTATPDSLQPLLRDLFRVNTFWEFETKAASAKQIKAGAWQVTLTLEASKLAVDSARHRDQTPDERVGGSRRIRARGGGKGGRQAALSAEAPHQNGQADDCGDGT